MGGKEQRTIVEMMQDEITLDRIQSWGEWNFLAKDVPVELEDFPEASYDVVTVDLENRRIQADIIGYDADVKEILQRTVNELDNEYGYIAPNISGRVRRGDDFPPKPVDGRTFWIDEEAWMLETSEFQEVTDKLFGYNPCGRYDRIDQDFI